MTAPASLISGKGEKTESAKKRPRVWEDLILPCKPQMRGIFRQRITQIKATVKPPPPQSSE